MYAVEPAQSPDTLDFEVTFVDNQMIQNFEEKVLGVLSTLQSNYDALSSLQKKLDLYWNIDKNLTFYLAQHKAKLGNVSSLLGRVQGISRLVSLTIPFTKPLITDANN